VGLLPDDFDASLGLATVGLRVDQLDGVSFPRSGYLLWLDAQLSRTQFGASSNYLRIAGEARTAFSHGVHTLQLSVRGGTSGDDDELPVYALFRLGGFLDMSGYRQQQLLGPRFAYGRALYQAKLARVPLLEGIYGGLAYEIADMPQAVPLNDKKLFQSGTAYLAADTPLGAAYFGVGYADAENRAVYLYLGRPF
jgi:NTE family protein